ncbi:hypothetical protein AYO22_02772 [Fonsecaea multimorphosa]|nr:hypothetical protein AYO22_02772 [Fonsecaea multimorphosa]
MHLAEAVESLMSSDVARQTQQEPSTAESLAPVTEENRSPPSSGTFSARQETETPSTVGFLQYEDKQSLCSASFGSQTADRALDFGDSGRATITRQQPQGNRFLQLGISSELIFELVDLFFLKIQPWLPLLHRPRFQRWLDGIATGDGLSNAMLTPDEEILLFSVMALSARFSPSAFFAGSPPLQRGRQFAEQARLLQRQLDVSDANGLPYLQACILLTFYCYCSGPTSQGWMLSGTCTRAAYDLGLAEIDGERSLNLDPDPVDHISTEEKRRAWWLVWELDSFASIISRRPFGIDRRRVNVMLPVSDEDWFAGTVRRTCKLDPRLGPAWKTLRDHQIKDEYAWFLTATHFVATISDRFQRKAEIDLDEILSMENEIASFKLALPPNFRIDSHPLMFKEETFARCNRVIGTLLLLMDATYHLNCLSSGKTNPLFAYRVRAAEISRLIRQWPGDYVALAHPFHATSMLSPPPIAPSLVTGVDAIISSSRDLEKLVLSRFRENWILGSVVLECSHILEKGSPPTPTEKQIMWRYALYFPSYGTVELGQSRADVLESDVCHLRAPDQERAAECQSYHLTGNETSTLAPPSSAAVDWCDILPEPVGGDEMDLMLPQIPNGNEIIFPYVNVFGAVQ